MSNLTRRDVLIRALTTGSAAILSPSRTLWAADEIPSDLAVLKKAEQAIAKVAGKAPLSAKPTEHFQAVGDAPAAFMGQALTISERLMKDYRSHFLTKGFKIDPPKSKMTVVVLSSSDKFRQFLGADPGDEVTGIYDLDSNWLVMFDNRKTEGKPKNAATPAELVNSFVLIHETFHLMNYNTGLLNRESPPPLCVSEGLATYAETRRADGRTPIGKVNSPRLQGLILSQREGNDWIPLDQLLAKDDHFENEKLVQAAYAQSWIFIYHLMQNKGTAAKLRDYLQALFTQKNPNQRLADAAKHLGDLGKLDADLRKLATRLTRS